MDNNPPLSLCKREILTGAPDSKSAKPYCRPFLSTPALSPGQPLNVLHFLQSLALTSYEDRISAAFLQSSDTKVLQKVETAK